MHHANRYIFWQHNSREFVESIGRSVYFSENHASVDIRCSTAIGNSGEYRKVVYINVDCTAACPRMTLLFNHVTGLMVQLLHCSLKAKLLSSAGLSQVSSIDELRLSVCVYIHIRL